MLNTDCRSADAGEYVTWAKHLIATASLRYVNATTNDDKDFYYWIRQSPTPGCGWGLFVGQKDITLVKGETD